MLTTPVDSTLLYFNEVKKNLSLDIINQNYRESIDRIAQFLPSFEVAGLEVRLDDNPRVDFLVCINPYNVADIQQLLDFEEWNIIKNICSDWIIPKSDLNTHVDKISLEFDIFLNDKEIQLPSIFLALKENFPSSVQDIVSFSRYFNLPSQRFINPIDTLIESLPKGAKIAHLGAMLPRNAETLRIVIRGFTFSSLKKYLVDINWPGDIEYLYSLLTLFEKFDFSLAIGLEVGETLSSVLSIELPFNQSEYLNSCNTRQSFFEFLVELGLCSSAKQQSLYKWVGVDRYADNPDNWPKTLRLIESFMGDSALSIIWRGIHHIKFSVLNNQNILAKAYLSFGHSWVDLDKVLNLQLNSTYKDIKSNLNHYKSDYIKLVKEYYDTMSPVLRKDFGLTFQAGLIKTNSDNSFRETNLYCAHQAGLSYPQHVLDAGCGLCGPAIDIGKHFPGITISAVTISNTQYEMASSIVSESGCSEQIQLYCADFHDLPFLDNTFDTAYFFESIGYSYDIEKLLREIHRVLKTGGILYIKEPFCKEGTLSRRELLDLSLIEEIYVYKARTMQDTLNKIKAANFTDIICENLNDEFSFNEFMKLMLSNNGSKFALNELGARNFFQYKSQPIYIGSIKAQKSSCYA